MNIIYVLIFIINISCFNLVKTTEPKCNFTKISNSDGLINLTYMNCYTYYGDSAMKYGLVHYPNSSLPAYGISKVRGNYKFELKN